MVEDQLPVLVVEDDMLVRVAAVHMLISNGFVVFEAASADEALLILAQENAIDIIFTDVDMPGSLDGIDLARHVMQNCQGVAVMVTSGRKNPPTCLPVEFLPKPYDMSSLEPRLRALKR